MSEETTDVLRERLAEALETCRALVPWAQADAILPVVAEHVATETARLRASIADLRAEVRETIRARNTAEAELAALARVHAVCTRLAPSQPNDDESVPYSRGWNTALDAVQAALATLTRPGPLCDLPHATIDDEAACDQAAADRGGEA